MRPEKLVLQNVGPFHGTPIAIDFDALDRLFLVTGDTGAGKTTLLDAISFALYGRPLGTREPTSMRSQHAADDEETSVELVFRLRERRYRIVRTPEYQRRKLRGAGTTRAEQSVVFFRQEGADFVPVPGKTSEVNQRIAETLGLDFDNFSRILVLPQGQFQQFLEMKSESRGELLEKLFPIALHRRLIELAAERARDRRRELEQHDATLSTLVTEGLDPSRIEADRAALVDEARMAAEARTLADEVWSTALKEAEAARELLRRFAEFDAATEGDARWHRDAPAIEAQRGLRDASARARIVAPSLDRRDAATASVARAEVDLRSLDEATVAFAARVASSTAEQDELPVWVERLTTLEAGREPARRGIVELESFLTLERALARHASESERHTRSLDEARRAAEGAKQELDAFVAARASADELERTAGRLREELATLRTLEAAATFLAASGAALETLETKRTLAHAEHLAELEALETARRRLREADEARDRDRAAAIAVTLEPGGPCPVCGSPDHPSPATHGDSIAAIEARRSAANDAIGAHEKLVRARESVLAVLGDRIEDHRARVVSENERLRASGFESSTAYRTKVDGLRAESERLASERALFAPILDDGARREASMTEARARVERLEAASHERAREEATLRGAWDASPVPAESRKNAQAALEIARRRLEENLRLADECRGRVRAIEAVRAALEHERAALERDRIAVVTRLGLASEALAREELAVGEALGRSGFADESLARAALRDVAVDEADGRAIEAHARTRTILDEALARLSQELYGRERPDPLALDEREREARRHRDELTRRDDDARLSLRRFAERAERYLALRGTRDALEAGARPFLLLAADLGGDNPERTDFAKFALQRFFEAVLAQASIRLGRLTVERYEFILDTGVSDRRTKAGLEIDVFDSHLGGKRDVRTLSGGEKFLASLALALGLSDVIEARAGGIALDALFVDEGFGSLDAETLDRALAVLDEVGASRMVGVISHVDTMRSAIPSQLRVVVGKRGSTVELA